MLCQQEPKKTLSQKKHTLMASSSHKKQKYYDPSDQVRELRKEERGRDWLELGLGFSSSSSSGCKKRLQHDDHSHTVSASVTAASSSPIYPNQCRQIGLGLECSNSCLGFDYKKDDVVMPNSWQMDTGSFIGWQMRSVFNDTHNYYNTRRPHFGFWFTLHSTTSRNNGEAALPQIPKAYIRVKDENVMVLMVKKYLVTKLGLSNEAEVEISCMEQKLLQWQTLKHVRDRVWLPRMRSINSTTALLMGSTSPIDYYLLPLHYYRSTDFSLPC